MSLVCLEAPVLTDKGFPDPPAKRPRILILGTGGTIAGTGPMAVMQGSAAYRSAVLDGAALVGAVPGINEIADIELQQLFQIDSADFDDARLLELGHVVHQACQRSDVTGVVITHGTDTLEESAYFLHLTIPTNKPVVLTGAMRPSTALAADGPANLRDAIALAAHPSCAGQGVLVVMNQDIFSARDVYKAASMRLDAFASAHGALGAVAEGRPRWYRSVTRPHTLASEFRVDRLQQLPLVGLVASHGNMCAASYEAWVQQGARAIVHAGFGGGSVPAYLSDDLIGLGARGVVLIRCSKTPDGLLIRNATTDDSANGWVVADDQNPPRARLLAALALTRSEDPAELQDIFWRY